MVWLDDELAFKTKQSVNRPRHDSGSLYGFYFVTLYTLFFSVCCLGSCTPPAAVPPSVAGAAPRAPPPPPAGEQCWSRYLKKVISYLLLITSPKE